MMPEPPKPPPATGPRPDWRADQTRRKRARAFRKQARRLPAYASVLVLVSLAVYALAPGIGSIRRHFGFRTDPLPPALSDPLLAPSKVRSLVQAAVPANPVRRRIEAATDGTRYLIETSFDEPLQRDLLAALNPDHARYIAVVALDPATGRVLAMVGHDERNRDRNPCLDSRFPAASIFKIVSAAAAIEQCRFDTGTQTRYNGRNHTLYKSQLKDTNNRYTRKISFQQAFARSINPVFGKIGAHCLGKEHLQHYGEAFGFNRPIDFDLPLGTSRLRVAADEPYQWAEVASGFNRETTLSPLHGALIAAAVANGGVMMAPRMVDRVLNPGGHVCHQSRPGAMGRVAAPETCRVLKRMMAAVITTGTCKKVFRKYRNDSVLSRLNIGGKSGSINNRQQDARFDWFIGYAGEKNSTARLAVSAVVAHENYIGKRAAQYAREAMRLFFQHRFSQAEKKRRKKAQA